MQSFLRARVLKTTLAVLHLVVQIALTVPQHAWAQNFDTDPPVIDFKPVEEGYRDDSQVFTATVTDDRSVDSVILHYRLEAESVYQNREMERLGETDIFSTSVGTAQAAAAIEYYIEATDLAGNRTLQGFAFDPIKRTLVERAPVQNVQVPAEEPTTGMSTRDKVLYGVLGLVLVGAIASAAGGSGGGSGGSSPLVDVTVVVEPLP